LNLGKRKSPAEAGLPLDRYRARNRNFVPV
jgi:hypothetical protein